MLEQWSLVVSEAEIIAHEHVLEEACEFTKNGPVLIVTDDDKNNLVLLSMKDYENLFPSILGIAPLK